MSVTIDPPRTGRLAPARDADHPSAGPTAGALADERRSEPLARADAEELGRRIQQQAARIAEATCALLEMVADFDARDGMAWFAGLKSTAHWLAWACSMSPGTAREHVRVARTLRSMPRTLEEFRRGRLSYSKVREMTRVADRVDEEALVDLARETTASQLARTVSAFRAGDGDRIAQDAVREARWTTREDGMIEVRALLPAEIGAEVVTALDLALDRDGHDAPAADPDATAAGMDRNAPSAEAAADARATTTATLEQRRADALLDVARGYLQAAPSDRSGEDRHLVVVQVSAEALTRDVPAGTPTGVPAEPAGDDPAAAPEHCGVLGQGPLEVPTAERLACTGNVAVAITGADGEILHLGRSQRLASRAQRRALRLRDRACTFPGCHQDRHLDAHHVTPWSQGGGTDIEGLALLCRRHHVMVHEGGLRLRPAPHQSRGLLPRFQVVDRSGRPVQARWPAMLEHVRTRPDTTAAACDEDPERIAPADGGAGFRLADCVDLLCQNVLTLAA